MSRFFTLRSTSVITFEPNRVYHRLTVFSKSSLISLDDVVGDLFPFFFGRFFSLQEMSVLLLILDIAVDSISTRNRKTKERHMFDA